MTITPQVRRSSTSVVNKLWHSSAWGLLFFGPQGRKVMLASAVGRKFTNREQDPFYSQHRILPEPFEPPFFVPFYQVSYAVKNTLTTYAESARNGLNSPADSRH